MIPTFLGNPAHGRQGSKSAHAGFGSVGFLKLRPRMERTKENRFKTAIIHGRYQTSPSSNRQRMLFPTSVATKDIQQPVENPPKIMHSACPQVLRKEHYPQRQATRCCHLRGTPFRSCRSNRNFAFQPGRN